ncbi:uncharacterized protein METZ01_LOCUS291940, partial [marine metagenome]
VRLLYQTIAMSHQNNPLSHPSAPVQRGLQGPPAGKTGEELKAEGK